MAAFFSARTPLNFFAEIFLAVGFLTAMNFPTVCCAWSRHWRRPTLSLPSCAFSPHPCARCRPPACSPPCRSSCVGCVQSKEVRTLLNVPVHEHDLHMVEHDPGTGSWSGQSTPRLNRG